MLPRTIGSETFQWLIKDCVFTEDNVTDNDGLIHAVWTVIILRNLLRQNNTAGMELGCIDFKRIRDLYPHIVLQPLFARLSSAPDLIYYQIVHERTGDVEHSPISWVVQSDTLRMLSQELAFFADSENKLLSNRARRCIASLLVLDIYCRTAILQALSTTRYASTREFTLLIETRQVRNFVAKELFSGGRPYRHCDAGGNLVHVCDYNCTEDYIGGKKHELRLSIEAVLELHIQRGEAFSCAGHHPIIAGRTANGEIAYVAVARFKSYGGRYCTVTEGMKPENLYLAVRDPDSNVVRMRTPKSFIVYVLRYAPAAYTTNMDWDLYGAPRDWI
ncbi:hypothetical protein DFH11DRAFT_143293 [Phellopilus nigrolimitatus]|nr:hypothetical protein DFH11DRAFT_143293 [Phellopilus nigrolimitatus]